MTCHEIVVKLLAYRLQLNNILAPPGHNDVTLDVVNQYAFINIRIHKSGQSFGEVRFELTDEAGKLISLYCEDSAMKEALLPKLEQEKWPGWSSSSSIDIAYSDQVLQCMHTADSIAALTKNCARGDQYHPGNFSKISITSDRIQLAQINHMNAKSLSHKNDYSLRNLVFTIPLQSNQTSGKFLRKYQIGIMTVEISDLSSQNNRKCGEATIAELERLAKTFAP